MERLWTRMIEAYGGAWARQYGLAHEGPYETWKRALLDLTAKQIGRGFDEALQHHQDFPPNLPQFLALCQIPPDGPCSPPRNWLIEPPSPRMAPEKAQTLFAELQRILRDRANDQP